jgi:hypothetical protein
VTSGVAAGLYSKLESVRQPFLDRGRKCAKITLPTLLPPQGTTGTHEFETPYQSVGARGVNNVSAKLLLALFPPNSPFFKMGLDEMTLEQVTGQAGARAEVDKALAKIEKKIMAVIETRALRVSIFELIKHLVVVGNCLIYFPPGGRARVYRLDKYVTRRAPDGEVLEIVIKETMAKETLPKAVLAILPEAPAAEPTTGSQPKIETVDVFTHVYRHGGKYHVYQEIEGKIVPKSKGSFPLDKCPWLALRFVKTDGEDYGRSLVEEYLGDLASLENLSKALDEAAQLAAMVRFIVRPNATMKPTKLAEAKNGGFVQGDINDVKVLQLEKYGDLRVAQERATALEQRLAFAFLLNTAIQRPGERVTAEEIRFMARELEDALGGVYSLMSQELQLPLVNNLIFQLEEEGELPTLPPQVKPTIVTGLEAIGRGQDLTKLDAFVAGLAETPAAAYVRWGDYATRRGVALGIDLDGLILTEQEKAAQDQQALMQAMIEKLGPNAVNQLGGLAQKGMEQNAPSGEAQAPA